ncbi:MAG: SLC13 family permease [Muribaculaceae bacterium]|nr:SLC13 family permease [Muribaculaceae bacterium]
MTAIGAIIGLLLAVLLIIKKISPALSLIAGALVGGIVGGLPLDEVVVAMTSGVKDITPAIIRILTAGVLTGILIKTGAAETLSNAIIKSLGEKQVYLALALSTMILCAVGVFIDVAVITVAPVAISLGRKIGASPSVLLVAMIGGGKAGNIMSPNPNTIVAAENFHAELSSVMFSNIIPAIIGLIVTVYIVVKLVPNKTVIAPSTINDTEEDKQLPSLWSSLVAPIVTVILLAMRPLFGFNVDPLIALPVGGLAGIICMRRWTMILPSLELGIQKMSSVAILLIGTGTIAGIIKNSTLKDWILNLLSQANVSDTFIAPISSALMSAATASTTAGATLASASFADVILAAGISATWGAAMVNSGATVLDHLPHGSFFHATGGVCELNFKERLKLIPYETLIGFVLAACSTLMCIIFN